MWSHVSIADSRPGHPCSSASGTLSGGRDPSALTDEASLSLSFLHHTIFSATGLSATGAAAVSH
jgi:hypothetical protein